MLERVKTVRIIGITCIIKRSILKLKVILWTMEMFVEFKA